MPRKRMTFEERLSWLKPIDHGTRQGYQMELYRGIETCRECRDAWNRDQKKRRRKNKIRPLRKEDE